MSALKLRRIGLQHNRYNKEVKKIDFWDYVDLTQQEIIDEYESFYYGVKYNKNEIMRWSNLDYWLEGGPKFRWQNFNGGTVLDISIKKFGTTAIGWVASKLWKKFGP